MAWSNWVNCTSRKSQAGITSFFWSGTFHEFPKLAAYWERSPPIVVKSSWARTKKNADSFCDCQWNPSTELQQVQVLNLCTFAYHQHCCCRFHTVPLWLPSVQLWQSRRWCCSSQTLLLHQGRFPQTQSLRASERSLLHKEDMIHSVSKARRWSDWAIHWMWIKRTILENWLSIWN